MAVGFENLTPFEENLRRSNPAAFEEYLKERDRLDRAREVKPLADRTSQIVNMQRGAPDPHGVLGKGVDFLSRGNYAAAKFWDVVINEEGPVVTEDGEAVSKTWAAVKGFFSELTNPEERLFYKDVIAKANPTWATKNPKSATLLGFMLDVVVDPINALSFGAGPVFRSGVKLMTKGGELKHLNKAGVGFFEEVADTIKVEGVGIEELSGPTLMQETQRVFQELLDPTNLDELAKRPRVTASQKEVYNRQLKGKVFGVADEYSDWGAIQIGQNDLHSLVGNKGAFQGTLKPKTIRELEEKARRGDKVSEELLSVTRSKSTTLEVTPLSNKQAIDNLESVGTKKGRDISVLFPDKYLKTTLRKDGVGRGKTLASTDYDLGDLRFIVDDSDEVFSFQGLQDHLNRRLQREKWEVERIKKAQELGHKVLKEKNLTVEDLLDKGGVKLFGKTVVGTDAFKGFMNSIGATKALAVAATLPVGKELATIAKAAKENFGLTNVLEKHAPEWMRFRRHIEQRKLEAIEVMAKAFDDVFSVEDFPRVSKGQPGAGTIAGPKSKRTLTTDEREEITEFLSHVQNKQKEFAEEAGIKSETVSYEMSQEIFQKELSNSNLKAAQKKAVVKLQQAYNNFYKLELEAGIAKNFFTNYNPIRYENISDVKKYAARREWDRGQYLKQGDTFVKKKRFKTKEEAEAAGFQPIMDAGQLFLLRFIDHQSALRKAEWEKWIDDAYGSVKKMPEIIEKDLVRLGEVYYPPRYGEAGKLFSSVFHSVSNAFRKSATIVRFPAFAAKQTIGNFTQAFAEMGVSAGHIFDPETLGIAGAVLTEKGKNMPGIKTVFGIEYTGKELYELIHEFPVRKGIALERIGYTSERDSVKRLVSDLYAKKSSKDHYKTTAGEGMKDLFLRGLKPLNLPAYVEDTYRIGMFVTALKEGNTPQAAMNMVDNALFNYTSGLSRLEQQIRTAFIPFYSFQRFGLGLLTKTLAHSPARINVSLDTVRGFFDVWNKVAGGETLTENERSVLPGYLLEQPRVLEKFDKIEGVDTAVFRTFNNMAFFDVLNVIETNEKGEFDPEETLFKGALAQLAPYVKVPLEMFVFKRELFTERALDGVYAGSAGDIDYDRFIQNLTTQIGMHGGVGGAGLGFVGGQILKHFGTAEKAVKELIGWEEGVHPGTGRRTVYINPWLLHASRSFFPALNMGIRSSRRDMEFTDNVLYHGFGIGTAKLDLERAGISKARSAQYEFRHTVSDYKKYMRDGRMNSADQARKDLMELLEYNQEEFEKWLDPNIRGGSGF